MSRLFGPQAISTFRWVGDALPLLDTPTVIRVGRVVVGRFGGTGAAGATSNEDGALVWCATDGSWELATLLDAHFTAQSAELVISAIEHEQESLTSIFAQPAQIALPALQQHILALFSSPEFRARCRQVEGEASCLIFLRTGPYLRWLSIGDCVGYLVHEELAQHGQFEVNQRTFYEWVGQHNTFDLPVPCYSSGTQLLRSGWNTVLMATDGLFEWGSYVFANPLELCRLFAGQSAAIEPLEAAARTALSRVHAEAGRDSATLLVWRCLRQGL